MKVQLISAYNAGLCASFISAEYILSKENKYALKIINTASPSGLPENDKKGFFGF